MVALCECDCGEPAPIRPNTDRRRGWAKGEPARFVHRHNFRAQGPAYIVDLETGCWVWQRARDASGYGSMWDGAGRVRRAHIVIYECEHGPVPAGLQLDHLCRCRACVNPAHLEPVTPAENIRRSVRTRLTATDVLAIRADYGAGGVLQSDLAQRYGVTREAISAVTRRITWRDIPEPVRS